MDEESPSKLTVEQLQSGEMPNIFSFFDISIFDVIVNLFLFISIVLIFLALIKIYKIKNNSAIKYLAISLGIFIVATIIPVLVTMFVLLISDSFESELDILIMGIVYLSGFFGTLFFFIGAIKLKKYANTL